MRCSAMPSASLALTNHARRRMALRGITWAQVCAVVDTGGVYPTGTTTVHFDLEEWLAVVVDWQTAEVITVYFLRYDRWQALRHYVEDEDMAKRGRKIEETATPVTKFESFADAKDWSGSGIGLIWRPAASTAWRPETPDASGYYWWYRPGAAQEELDRPVMLEVIVDPHFAVFCGDRRQEAADLAGGFWCGPVPTPEGWVGIGRDEEDDGADHPR